MSKKKDKLAQLWIDLNHSEDEAVFFIIEFHYLQMKQCINTILKMCSSVLQPFCVQ